MKKIMILGKNTTIMEQEADRDSIQFKDDEISIKSYKKPAISLLSGFLADLLYSELFKIYEQMKKSQGIEVLGDLDFEIVDKIDNKNQRVAKLKGNKILVKLNAVVLPEEALKYVIAHEIAHILTKRHTKKFWKVVETIYPDFKIGQKLLFEHKGLVYNTLLP